MSACSDSQSTTLPLPSSPHCEPTDLVEQRLRIQHDAVADDRQLALADHPRGQQRELVGYPIDDQRMARIVPALKAHHDVGLLGEPVDHLPLAFVAPLGANHDHIGHEVPFLEARRSQDQSRDRSQDRRQD